MENLPGDLVSNIFVRLMAKQLAQMRCVSKSWNALLSQSSFVKSHLHHSINNNDRILLIFYNKTSSSRSKQPAAYLCRSPHTKLANFIRLPRVNGYTTNFVHVVGSVHGLICLCYCDDVIRIWNPSLSAMSTLPRRYLVYHGSYETYFRFRFDPKTEDYKVVKIIGLTRAPRRQSSTLEYVVNEWLQVEVYSMRKSSWGYITQSFPSHITWISYYDSVCVDGHDGHLHWLGYIDEEGKVETIVAFDLVLERFREIPLPTVINTRRENILGVMGGKVCVMSWYEDGDKYDGIEVGVMGEYGVGESWVKHHVFSQFHDCLVYGFTSHSEFVISDDDCCDLVLYDPTAHKANNLKKFHVGKAVIKIVEYVDSLVWLAPTKH